MTRLGPCRSRNSKSPQDEASEERAPPAHPAVHDDILKLLQFGPVILRITRPELDIGGDSLHVTPSKVGIGGDVRPVVTQHLTSPGMGLIRLISINHEPDIPCRQILEGRIQFAVHKGFLVGKVALDGIDDCRGIGEGRGIVLLDRNRMLQSHRQRHPLQHPLLGFSAGFLDGGINLHRLAIFVVIGTVGDKHLLHQFNIGQQLLNQCSLLRSLLGELGKTLWCRAIQDDEFNKFRIQLAVRQ